MVIFSINQSFPTFLSTFVQWPRISFTGPPGSSVPVNSPRHTTTPSTCRASVMVSLVLRTGLDVKNVVGDVLPSLKNAAGRVLRTINRRVVTVYQAAFATGDRAKVAA
jgi:hypothetical protein